MRASCPQQHGRSHPTLSAATTAAVVALALIGTVAPSGALAGLPPGADRTPNWVEYTNYFSPECPDECRDVDAFVTCGSVDHAASCDLAYDGNVSMTCIEGVAFRTTMLGCERHVNATQAAAYASTRVELWTMYRFVSNFGVMLRAPRIPGTRDLVAASFIELAVTIAALCAAPWHPTLGRGLVGATAGLVVGHLCLAVGNVRLGPWYTVLPLLVCPAVMAALCVKFRRVALSSAGAVIAVWLLSVAAFEYTSRSVDVVRPWMLYVLLGIAAVCAYLATLSPKRTRCAFEVLLAATCGCAAVIQLIGPLVSGGTWSSLTSARSDCGYAVNEAVYVAAVLVCAVVRNRVMWRVEAAAARSCVTQERDEEMLYGSA